MKQGVDKSEEAGLLNPEKAIADVQSSPVGVLLRPLYCRRCSYHHMRGGVFASALFCQGLVVSCGYHGCCSC